MSRKFVLPALIAAALVFVVFVTCEALAWESEQIRAHKDGWAVVEDQWYGFVRMTNKTDQRHFLTCKLRVFDSDDNLLGKGWTEPVRVRPHRARTSELIVEKRNIERRFDHWRIVRCAVIDNK